MNATLDDCVLRSRSGQINNVVYRGLLERIVISVVTSNCCVWAWYLFRQCTVMLSLLKFCFRDVDIVDEESFIQAVLVKIIC